MKRLLREPLVHFLLVGAALFAVYGLTGKGSTAPPGTIVITKGQIASLAVEYEHTWQRPPTPEELDELIEDRVREEVYYREAMALGLDRDDTIIRRRLRQKMEFISEDVGAQPEPTDVELAAYLQAHPDAFRVEGRVPALADVRGAVRLEFINTRRLAANEVVYRGLLEKYRVTIERR